MTKLCPADLQPAFFIVQYVACVLHANYWWDKAPTNRESIEQKRGEWYDTAACRALEYLDEQQIAIAHRLYHETYIRADRSDRAGLALKLYPNSDFIIV